MSHWLMLDPRLTLEGIAMTMRRLSLDQDCKSGYTCPAVLVDDADPGHLIVVGVPVAPETVTINDGQAAVGMGEVAIRVKRQVIADAGIE